MKKIIYFILVELIYLPLMLCCPALGDVWRDEMDSATPYLLVFSYLWFIAAYVAWYLKWKRVNKSQKKLALL